MKFTVDVVPGEFGVLWLVCEPEGTLVAAVHSSGETAWYAPRPPSIIAESLVGAIREWCRADHEEYGGLNERKLGYHLSRAR